MGPKVRLQRKLELFPSGILLQFVPIDIVGVLPRIKSSNQFVLILTDQYSKLTRTIPTSNTTWTQVDNNVFDNCVILYSLSGITLSDNGQQFTGKCFNFQMVAIRSEAARGYSISPSNKRSGWSMQAEACITTPTLRLWHSTRLTCICSAAYVRLQLSKI